MYMQGDSIVTQNTGSIMPFYKGWDVYQGHLMRVIAPLTDEQLALTISPNLRSIGLLAKHIVRTRASWMHNLMGEGGPELAEIAQWEHDGDMLSAAELARGLEVTWRVWQECLQRWTQADLEYVFTGERWGKPYELSRQWIVWHVIEHDMHHGGELSFALGAHGLPAIGL